MELRWILVLCLQTIVLCHKHPLDSLFVTQKTTTEELVAQGVKTSLTILTEKDRLEPKLWKAIRQLEQHMETGRLGKAQKQAKLLVQTIDDIPAFELEVQYGVKTLRKLTLLVKMLNRYCDLPLMYDCFTDGDCDIADAPGCVKFYCDHGECKQDDSKCEVSPSDEIEEVTPECTIDEQCDDHEPCTKDSCIFGACLSQKIPHCELCSNAEDCNDWDACTLDKCSDGLCMHIPIPDCDCEKVRGFLCHAKATCMQSCSDCGEGYFANPENGECVVPEKELCGKLGKSWCPTSDCCVDSCADCRGMTFDTAKHVCIESCESEHLLLCPTSGACVNDCLEECGGEFGAEDDDIMCHRASEEACADCGLLYCPHTHKCTTDCTECDEANDVDGNVCIKGKPDEEETGSQSSTCRYGYYCPLAGARVINCCKSCGDAIMENEDECTCVAGKTPLEFLASYQPERLDEINPYTYDDDSSNYQPVNDNRRTPQDWDRAYDRWTFDDDGIPGFPKEDGLAYVSLLVQRALLHSHDFPKCGYTMVVPKDLPQDVRRYQPADAYDIVSSWILPDGAMTFAELVGKEHHKSQWYHMYKGGTGWGASLRDPPTEMLWVMLYYMITEDITGPAAERINQVADALMGWYDDFFDTQRSYYDAGTGPEGIGPHLKEMGWGSREEAWDVTIQQKGGYREWQSIANILMYMRFEGSSNMLSHLGRSEYMPGFDIDDGVGSWFSSPRVPKLGREKLQAAWNWWGAEFTVVDQKFAGGYLHYVNNAVLPPKCIDPAHNHATRDSNPASYGTKAASLFFQQLWMDDIDDASTNLLAGDYNGPACNEWNCCNNAPCISTLFTDFLNFVDEFSARDTRMSNLGSGNDVIPDHIKKVMFDTDFSPFFNYQCAPRWSCSLDGGASNCPASEIGLQCAYAGNPDRCGNCLNPLAQSDHHTLTNSPFGVCNCPELCLPIATPNLMDHSSWSQAIIKREVYKAFWVYGTGQSGRNEFWAPSNLGDPRSGFVGAFAPDE
eukprot:TRINITY_DN64978_c0_g1_i2.p1 TRINITY_DN64978_c0_g1~~TRINITY_DN64978_c0_g1_i2.p1  ORF type:complete len:1012 (+),score=93.44 TRINITY_DN64978_c0_g1_i2:71-3106(+)